MNKSIVFLFTISLLVPAVFAAQQPSKRADYIRNHYSKFEYEIPMRDGITLFTSVYVPYDDSKSYPILMSRTPYSVGPYGVDKYPTRLGPSEEFEQQGYIFVRQDVRGRFRSEGEFINMRPQDAYKRGKGAVDDATDSYDTIDWLVKNIPNNNGRVGMWGVSYPGYYTSVASVNAHPALKAISPQAPIADWFFDDFHRNGAFVLPMAFVFFDRFDNFPEGKHNVWPKASKIPTHDGYQFYRDLGPLSNVNKLYFKNQINFWNELAAHPNYDDYWQAKNLLPHLKKTKPATLVVGGWYDTEDLYGPLQTYQAMSRGNREEHIKFVMGPWYHGQWNRDPGNKMGEADFGMNSGIWFQKNVLLPFFEKNLKPKQKNNTNLAQATMFDTGAKRWQKFSQWPPKNTQEMVLYLEKGEQLTKQKPDAQAGYSEYVSDPNKPVPHSAKIGRGWDREYMSEDQRFAARRPDVLIFETEVLDDDMTIAGALNLSLKFATDKTAADIIVKLVDVFPANDLNKDEHDKVNGNRHELVRWGSLRGRFRDSFSEPKPFVANQVTDIQFDLYDVMHTFKRGHKIQILVQSSMFPFIDLNPQTYVDNIFEAKESDFVRANHRVYHSASNPSEVRFRVINN